MDAEQHRRFLNYLELKQYFVRGGKQPLDAESFLRSDGELTQLLERERRGHASGDDVRRIVALRRELLRD